MTLNYNSPASLKAFLKKEGLGMQKKFGQNFLINPQIRQALADSLDARPGDDVWEIGPGLGAMTEILLSKKFNVKAFEIDQGFIRVLKDILSGYSNFRLIEGDVMKTWRTQKASPFLLGNLPYNIGSALLADMIEKGRIFSRMAVTVQKETAQRMTASAGTKDYSSFTVLCSSVYNIKTIALINRESFYPIPNVDSAGLLLENRGAQCLPGIFYPLVRGLFASRRKTIKNNLSAFISSMYSSGLKGISAQDVCAKIFRENGLSGMERAESLELDMFLSIAKSLENMRL